MAPDTNETKSPSGGTAPADTSVQEAISLLYSGEYGTKERDYPVSFRIEEDPKIKVEILSEIFGLSQARLLGIVCGRALDAAWTHYLQISSAEEAVKATDRYLGFLYSIKEANKEGGRRR